MPMSEHPRAKKLNSACSKDNNPDTRAPAIFLSGGEFEVISWLVVTGTLITLVLTTAYTPFDPTAALLGQFP